MNEPALKPQLQERETRNPRRPTPTEVEGSTIKLPDGQSIDALEVPKELRGELVISAMRTRLNNTYNRQGSKGVENLIAAWQEGRLTPGRKGDGTATTPIYILALAAKFGEPVAKVRQRVNAMSVDERRKLRNHPDTQAAIAKYRGENEGTEEDLRAQLFGPSQG